MAAVPALERTTFRTSRLLEFCSCKELVAQTGHEPDAWPLVVLKELMDNSLDACEEAGIAPEIGIEVEPRGITVLDNGPGMPPETVADTVSSRTSRCTMCQPKRDLLKLLNSLNPRDALSFALPRFG
jgi:hypothetical protein